MQLHEFYDASEAAYSDVIYIKALDEQEKIHVSIVIAKTKVAPSSDR